MLRGMRDVRRSLIAVAASLAVAACAPKAVPLRGAPAPARIPSTELPPVHRQVGFLWTYADQDFRVKGEGAARVAPPDSARLDFFVDEGLGGGRALLIDDRLSTPGPSDRVRDYLPPAPLLWAALGRLRVPAARDTVARVDGDTLRVEIGRDPAWRATFVRDDLRRLELIDGGRVPQWVTREPGGRVHYENARARRRLDLTITRVDTLPAFDATIWR